MGRHGLECDPAKIEDVKSWPVPDCLKSVRQFLGFVGYCRRFIPSFADVATPLVTLTGKDVTFVWDSSCLTAFAALHAALMDAQILAFPTETGLYVLHTDASNFGLGRVLSQVQNNQERVVVHCSPHRDAIALQNEKCWLQWPCVSSSDLTYVVQDSPFAWIISRWCGYIASKTQKA